MCREGQRGHPDEDPSRTEEKSGHRGQKQGHQCQGGSETSGQGEAGQSCKVARRRARGVSLTLPVSWDLNLGLLAPSPGLCPLATSLPSDHADP